MIDVFEVANAMARTSTCHRCKEGGVVVDNSTGNVTRFLRSYCTVNSNQCGHESAHKCPCYVSALGDAVVQGTNNLNNTSVTVVSQHYPIGYQDSYVSYLLSECGVTSLSYNQLGTQKANKKRVRKSKTCKGVKTEDTDQNKPKKLYGTATCVKCGQVFDKTSPRQKYCNRWKVGVCSICGKVFQYRCEGDKTPKTCGSEKCVHDIRSRHMLDLVKSQRKRTENISRNKGQ